MSKDKPLKMEFGKVDIPIEPIIPTEPLGLEGTLECTVKFIQTPIEIFVDPERPQASLNEQINKLVPYEAQTRGLTVKFESAADVAQCLGRDLDLDTYGSPGSEPLVFRGHNEN